MRKGWYVKAKQKYSNEFPGRKVQAISRTQKTGSDSTWKWMDTDLHRKNEKSIHSIS